MTFQTPAGFTVALWMNEDALRVELACIASFVRQGSARQPGACASTTRCWSAVSTTASTRTRPAFRPYRDAWHHVALRWTRPDVASRVDGPDVATAPDPKTRRVWHERARDRRRFDDNLP